MTQTANKYNWTNDTCAWHWEIKQGLVTWLDTLC